MSRSSQEDRWRAPPRMHGNRSYVHSTDADRVCLTALPTPAAAWACPAMLACACVCGYSEPSEQRDPHRSVVRARLRAGLHRRGDRRDRDHDPPLGAPRRLTRAGARGRALGLPAGLVGGRLYFLATSWNEVPDHWWGPLAVWQGGLGIWGGIALGTLGGLVVLRRRGADIPRFMDAAAPGLLVAQAIGRVGNYFNQELFGGPPACPGACRSIRRTAPPATSPTPPFTRRSSTS